MSSNTTITSEQLRTVLIATELGGKPGDSGHFSYARLGSSSSSFGEMQFDVDANPAARIFLNANGFDADDINTLRKHQQLSTREQTALDTKLQAVPLAKMEQFTNQQLDVTIARVGDIIDNVRKENPAAADAIVKDEKLQLGIADYANQFSSRHDERLASFLAGNPQQGIQSSNPPVREDMQNFIGATAYGRDPANARGIRGRAEHFNEAMAELRLGPSITVDSHASEETGSILKLGSHGKSVGALQADLASLGYTDSKGRPLKSDNEFGHDTQAAVRAFQRDHGLKQNGVGPKTQHAIQTALAPEKHFDSGPLPASVMSPSIFPVGVDDPRKPRDPNHALFNKLHQRIPDASQERLLQFTAACHSNKITADSLSTIHLDETNMKIGFHGTNFLSTPATVDLSTPPPHPQQAIQQIQQHDQQQTQMLGQIHAQNAPVSQHASQVPTPGVPSH
jgi:peptidoglycan hydrolase-like protein with peptidoglycan-binding domain